MGTLCSHTKIAANIESGNNVIQRYLIVGDTDFTAGYYQQVRTSSGAAVQAPGTGEQTPEAAAQATNTKDQILNETVTVITEHMLEELQDKLTSSTPTEDERTYIEHLIDSITQMDTSHVTSIGFTLRSQLSKWILDDVGAKGQKSHEVFGQKYQPRAYHTYYELAVALVGWVDAKMGRHEEKVRAGEIMSETAINYHLDSVFLHIKEFISTQDDASEIETEINNPEKPVNSKIPNHPSPKWALYQSYFSRRQDERTRLPDHWAVLMNPANTVPVKKPESSTI